MPVSLMGGFLGWGFWICAVLGDRWGCEVGDIFVSWDFNWWLG